MRRWLFSKALHLPEFKGKWRLVSTLRSGLAPYRCRTQFGFEMELDCFEWTQLHLAQHGSAEPLTMKLIQRLLKPGDVFLDVGAHVGFVSLVARQAVGEFGRVIAVEPQPYNCQLLLRNWEINGFQNLDLFVAAAGNELGSISLPQQSATDKARLSLALPMPDATQLEFRVPLRTLESIFSELEVETIKLLKIDVEGFELDVLKGLRKQLNRVQHIVFERLDRNAAEEQRSDEACEWLITEGFELKKVDGEGWKRENGTIESNLWAARTQTIDA